LVKLRRTEKVVPNFWVPVNSSHGQLVTQSNRYTVNSSQSTRHNHNYSSENLLAVIDSFGLHLSKVHSSCNTDRQRLKRVRNRRRLTI